MGGGAALQCLSFPGKWAIFERVRGGVRPHARARWGLGKGSCHLFCHTGVGGGQPGTGDEGAPWDSLGTEVSGGRPSPGGLGPGGPVFWSDPYAGPERGRVLFGSLSRGRTTLDHRFVPCCCPTVPVVSWPE